MLFGLIEHVSVLMLWIHLSVSYFYINNSKMTLGGSRNGLWIVFPGRGWSTGTRFYEAHKSGRWWRHQSTDVWHLETLVSFLNISETITYFCDTTFDKDVALFTNTAVTNSYYIHFCFLPCKNKVLILASGISVQSCFIAQWFKIASTSIFKFRETLETKTVTLKTISPCCSLFGPSQLLTNFVSRY